MKLHANRLSVGVGDRILVRDLALTVGRGQIVAIVGPNGSGKTTLLRALAGLHPTTGTLSLTGTLTLNGQPLHQTPPRQRARAIAYLPQHTPFSPGLSVTDTVMLGRLPHCGRLTGPRAEDRSIVRECLARLGLQAFSTRTLDGLSGGERQRVWLARMLATNASILVLDEPTTALDIQHSLTLLAELRSFASEGKAVIVVVHDLPLADHLADTIVCLHGDQDGTVELGPPHRILTPARVRAVFGVQFERTPSGRLQLTLR